MDQRHDTGSKEPEVIFKFADITDSQLDIVRAAIPELTRID
jgi:hypothetical protein